jgi:hypothetical protein
VSKRYLSFLGVLLWVAAIGGAFAALARYDNTSGAVGNGAPAQWPSPSHLGRTANLPTLIVALHPQCPCSRATLRNLERAMPQLNGEAQVHLLFVGESSDKGRPNDDLLRIAQNIRGTDIFQDKTGDEAKLFDVLTSGETLLYSPKGRLLFHGGITSGRSHEGDNPGLSAILAFVQNGRASRSSTSVFGCALSHNPKYQTGIVQ